MHESPDAAEVLYMCAKVTTYREYTLNNRNRSAHKTSRINLIFILRSTRNIDFTLNYVC